MQRLQHQPVNPGWRDSGSSLLLILISETETEAGSTSGSRSWFLLTMFPLVHRGVPQGSVLGPVRFVSGQVRFTLYRPPLGIIIQECGFSFPCLEKKQTKKAGLTRLNYFRIQTKSHDSRGESTANTKKHDGGTSQGNKEETAGSKQEA